MKKSLLFLSVLTSISMASCGGSNIDTSKIALDFGYVYKDGIYDVEQLEIYYGQLTDLIDKQESFVLLIFHDRNCGCWRDFYPVAIQYMNTYNVKFFAFDNAGLSDKTDKYGIYESTGSALPGICFFRRGKLIRQTIYGKLSSEGQKIFRDYDNFKSFMDENIYLPNMYYLDKAALDKKIEDNEQFNLYVARSGCGDCTSVNKNVLYGWSESNKENKLNDPLYVFDIQGYRGTEQYQTVKDTYGLSNTEFNPIFGYNYGEDKGMIPTFQRWKDGHINDMITVLNDKVEENNVITSYFTQERINASPMLKNSGSSYLINGKTADEKDIGEYIVPGTEVVYRYIYQETQLQWHRPILELYLSTYVK